MTLVLGAKHIFTTPAAKLHLTYHFMLFLIFFCTEPLSPWLPPLSQVWKDMGPRLMVSTPAPSPQVPPTALLLSQLCLLPHPQFGATQGSIAIPLSPTQVLSYPPASSGPKVLLTITPPSLHIQTLSPSAAPPSGSLRLFPNTLGSQHQKNPQATTSDHAKQLKAALPAHTPLQQLPPSTSKPC